VYRFSSTWFGEDALLLFSELNELRRFEVQAKDEASPVTLDRIAECLAHFPSHKADRSLLDRLLDDDLLSVVLVMSGRCDDAAVRYTVDHNWKGQAHPKGRIRREDAKQLLKNIRNRPA